MKVVIYYSTVTVIFNIIAIALHAIKKLYYLYI